MTWTYDDEQATAKDQVRFLVGDTDTTDQQVSDEAIAAWLAANNDNIYIAAAVIAESLAGKYARSQSLKIDSFSIDYSERAKSYRELAVRLRHQGRTAPGAMGSPIVSGVSIAAMDAVRDDTDRVPSRIKAGGMDNPGTEVNDQDGDSA